MIKKANEMMKEIREQMRGGKGEAEIIHMFQQDEYKGKARLFARINLEPGSSIGIHPHIDEEEIYYIVEGKGMVDDNGDKREVESGDAVLTGDGASHSIENTGDETLSFVAVIVLYS